jgi:hypothetical protein
LHSKTATKIVSFTSDKQLLAISFDLICDKEVENASSCMYFPPLYLLMECGVIKHRDSFRFFNTGTKGRKEGRKEGKAGRMKIAQPEDEEFFDIKGYRKNINETL